MKAKAIIVLWLMLWVFFISAYGQQAANDEVIKGLFSLGKILMQNSDKTIENSDEPSVLPVPGEWIEE